MTQTVQITGDAIDTCSSDLFAQIDTLAVGLPVPDGWRVLTGNSRWSQIARVAMRFEIMPEPENAFEALARSQGFSEEMTGGGCMALTRYLPAHSGHIMVTDDGGLQMPCDGPWMMGLYDADGEQVKLWQGNDFASYARALVVAQERAQEMQATFDTLTDRLADYCRDHGLPEMCAEELLHEDISPEQREWLAAFISDWNELEALEAMEQRG